MITGIGAIAFSPRHPPLPQPHDKLPPMSLLAVALGALIGSFLNVVIHRYPREESVVFPPSHCPHCNTNIKPWDNVPIVAWLWLRGRCRACRAPITARYPLVELANALFYLAIFQRTGLSIAFVPLAALVSMTIVLIYIDLDIQILPDVIDLPGIAIGLFMGWMQLGALYPDLMLSTSLLDSVIGALMGAGILLAIAMAYKLLRKIEGMGLGDVKMIAMLGAILGWEPLLPLLVVASVAGALVGAIVAVRSKEGMQVALPFGVFLGLAFLVVLFFGTTLWDSWLSLFAL
jgi:leader peptidase (prepilin peptidase)/N-methyltransferase